MGAPGPDRTWKLCLARSACCWCRCLHPGVARLRPRRLWRRVPRRCGRGPSRRRRAAAARCRRRRWRRRVQPMTGGGAGVRKRSPAATREKDATAARRGARDDRGRRRWRAVGCGRLAKAGGGAGRFVGVCVWGGVGLGSGGGGRGGQSRRSRVDEAGLPPPWWAAGVACPRRLPHPPHRRSVSVAGGVLARRRPIRQGLACRGRPDHGTDHAGAIARGGAAVAAAQAGGRAIPSRRVRGGGQGRVCRRCRPRWLCQRQTQGGVHGGGDRSGGRHPRRWRGATPTLTAAAAVGLPAGCGGVWHRQRQRPAAVECRRGRGFRRGG